MWHMVGISGRLRHRQQTSGFHKKAWNLFLTRQATAGIIRTLLHEVSNLYENGISFDVMLFFLKAYLFHLVT